MVITSQEPQKRSGALRSQVRSAKRMGGVMRYTLATTDGGSGVLRVHDLIPGLRMIAFDFRAGRYDVADDLGHLRADCSVFHCQRGSFEVSTLSGVHALEAGGVALTNRSVADTACRFPQGACRGMVLSVDRALSPDMRHLAGETFGLRLETFAKPIERGGGFAAVDAPPALTHAFAECYDLIPPADLGLVRLKAFELLLLVQRALEEAGSGERGGHAAMGRRMTLAYQAQELMMADLSQTLTINDLAEACNTSPTVLKESFKEAFGVPVYSWYRAYRIRRACELMKERTDASIASIAAEVGYANPSKFSRAFADVMGTTPHAWRESRAWQSV